MKIKSIIEEINSLIEDEMVDDFVDVSAEDTDIVVDEPVEENNDKDAEAVTDELSAKTKISRAIGVLKEAIADFKDSIISELDLVDDADFNVKVEDLDSLVEDMLNIISNKKEDAAELVPVEEPEETEAEEDIEDEDEEVDFDTEAALDLFPEEE